MVMHWERTQNNLCPIGLFIWSSGEQCLLEGRDRGIRRNKGKENGLARKAIAPFL